MRSAVLLIIFLISAPYALAMTNNDLEMYYLSADNVIEEIEAKFKIWKSVAHLLNNQGVEIAHLYIPQFIRNLREQLKISFDLRTAVTDVSIKNDLSEEIAVISLLDDCFQEVPSFVWVFIQGSIGFREQADDASFDRLFHNLNNIGSAKIKNIMEKRINSIEEFHRICDETQRKYQEAFRN